MIAYLKGKIKYIGANWIILDVNGVGYKVQVKSQKVKGKSGDKVEFYIYNHIREDRNELYGFETMEDLQFFELLISVNGVGPKMAMNILSHAKLEQLEKAINSNDTTLLTAIGGVGKKIATKIIIDLKNKIGKMDDADLGEIMEGGNELLDATTALGYKKAEIMPYLGKMPSKLISTEEKIKWLLKEMKS